MRPDPPASAPQAAPTKDQDPPSSPTLAPTAPTIRPKLNLQKRTVSQAEPSPAPLTGGSDAKASPFGAARPIDTSAREKEIEEKLKVRKEQEEKVREENGSQKIARKKRREARRMLESLNSATRKPTGNRMGTLRIATQKKTPRRA